MNKRARILASVLGITCLMVATAAAVAALGTNNTVYSCFRDSDGRQTTDRIVQLNTPPNCGVGNHWEKWGSISQASATTTTNPATTTTQPATTTQPSTTTQPATTTTQPTTTTTQPSSGAFLSYPHQSGPQSFSGTNLIISNRSYVGFTSSPGITVTNSNNVYIHDVDFDTMCGGIYLSHVTGNIRIENVRFRNIGGCGIGSGHSNAIQVADSQASSGGIRNNKFYGGHTEDVFSIYKSGGVDAAHVMVIENNHFEHPLSGTLAWTSTSSTCTDLADYGGHDILYQNNTLLNCGQVGIQMHQPGGNVVAKSNIVYGAARPASNVGLSQWSGTACSPCVGGNAYITNQVFWQKESGSASPFWQSNTYPVTADQQSKTQDPSTPQVHVVL